MVSHLTPNNHYNPTHQQQAPLLNAPTVHESVCRSASSSPRIDRRTQPGTINNQPLQPISTNPGFTLNVPVNVASRKLSLQPLGLQKNPPQPNLLADPNYGQLYQQPLLFQHQQLQPQQAQPLPHGSKLGGSVTNLNLLGLSSQHLQPRKSVIGRLERSSFQAQRLSDVGFAFGQQITANMGLKLPASQERIVEQTRWLYLRYVFVKLRQNALPLRDLNLTKTSRARRAAALGEMPEISASAPATATIGGGPSDLASLIASGGLSRKRIGVSTNIDPRDLSILAAKVQMTLPRSRGDSLSSSASNNPLSDLTGSSIAGGATNGALARKYVMDPTINNQIFSVIANIIRELRELKPEFYGDTIYELIGIDKFSSLQSLLDVQMTICQEMTRSEISWCRITALFSLFGAMSLDCVRLGMPEHVGPILDGFIEFVERDLALWISQQGGWEAFLFKYRKGFRFGQLLTAKSLTVILPLVLWGLISVFN